MASLGHKEWTSQVSYGVFIVSILVTNDYIIAESHCIMLTKYDSKHSQSQELLNKGQCWSCKEWMEMLVQIKFLSATWT